PAAAAPPAPSTTGTVDAGLNGSGTANPPADNNPTAAVSGSSSSSSSATAAAGDSAASGTTPAAQTADKTATPVKPTPVDTKEESTSKKKKGLKKLIPW
ncbi:MAG TPA: hypothetical protein VN902_17930, partial [Candidatus Acidoferrales bacterium]|nr:hypothetical protein [Candidatus Acidoferrales bacterium]